MNFLINNQKRYNVFLSALTPRKSSALIGNNCNGEVRSYCTVTFDAKTPMTPRKSSALETIAMVNRHGLMLLWLKDLIDVTEKLQFIDPTILLYTQKGPLVAAFRSPLMKALDRCRNVGSLKPNHV